MKQCKRKYKKSNAVFFMTFIIAAFLGAVGVGVTVTTMNPTYRPEEIARQLENSGARCTFN
jgi:acyl-CoA synthetase (AMP-forming)/AMP-acid ligase II